MSAATSNRSSAISSKSAIAHGARATSARTCEAQAQLAAEERVLDALVGAGSAPRRAIPSAASCAPANSTTRKSRSRSQIAGGMPMFDIPGMPGASDGRDLDRRHVRQGLGGAHQDAPHDRQGRARAPDRRGERQAARPGPARAGSDRRGREQRHRLPRRDRQDLRARRPRRRRRVARRRAARSAAADRRHDRLHQARRR